MSTYQGIRHYGKIVVIDKKTGLPTGVVLENISSDPHYIPDAADPGLCGNYSTTWVGLNGTCSIDIDGNTGYLVYSDLQEIRIDTGLPTGLEKENIEGF